jgi:hypothetical protein
MLVDVDGLAEALRPAVKAALARAIALELVELVEHGGRAEALGTGAPPAETGGAKELSVSITKGSPSVGAIPSVAPKPLRAQRAQQPPRGRQRERAGPRPNGSSCAGRWRPAPRRSAAPAGGPGPGQGAPGRSSSSGCEITPPRLLGIGPDCPGAGGRRARPVSLRRYRRRQWRRCSLGTPGRGACGKATAGSPMRSVPVWSAVRRRHTTGRGACSMRPPIASAAPRQAAPSACRTRGNRQGGADPLHTRNRCCRAPRTGTPATPRCSTPLPAHRQRRVAGVPRCGSASEVIAGILWCARG